MTDSTAGYQYISIIVAAIMINLSWEELPTCKKWKPRSKSFHSFTQKSDTDEIRFIKLSYVVNFCDVNF